MGVPVHARAAYIRKQFIKTQPLAGIRIAACLHVTPKPRTS